GAQPDSDEQPDTPDRVLRFESNLAYPTTWRLRLEDVGKWTFCGTLREHRESELRDAILTFMLDGGEGTAREIAKELGKREGDVSENLKQLVEQGEIEVESVKTGGRPMSVYRAKTSQPDEPFQPDHQAEKSQGKLIDLQDLGGRWGFSAHNPTPRG
ncbi:MAG: winged helix-turn-helix domain-containing protein, partial [bacterium]|nr:winged helix-turn-helix domain-containing protein [bacterium]